MTVQEAIAYIENYTWSTSKMGLERTEELLAAMGDPHRKLRFVHVTGSNGKGSTCAMVESVLRQAGYITGLYTSPHVCDFNERIRVCGVPIDDASLCEITEKTARFADVMEDHPSQFELVTAIAMEYFLKKGCEIVILEVGMGGALDSTNVIPAPLVAAFTNIGLEHTEYLGDSLKEIATTKGGIIKRGCRVVCYDGEAEATETIRTICEEKQVPFVLAKTGSIREMDADLDGQTFLYRDERLQIPLLGSHQIKNAAVALMILKTLRDEGFAITKEAVAKGLKKTFWPARFEVLKKDPVFILDGGHNPQCAKALAETIDRVLPGEKIVFLTGVLADKDYEQIADLIAPYALSCVCVTPENERALPAADYRDVFIKRGIRAEAEDTIHSGIRKAMALAGKNPVIAFGSLYMAGTIRKELAGEETWI